VTCQSLWHRQVGNVSRRDRLHPMQRRFARAGNISNWWRVASSPPAGRDALRRCRSCCKSPAWKSQAFKSQAFKWPRGSALSRRP